MATEVTTAMEKLSVGDSHEKRLVCIDEEKHSVLAYCKEEKQWKELMNVSWLDFGIVVKEYQDGLIVVGICNDYEGSKRVSYLNLKTCKEHRLPDLPEALYAAGVVCVGKTVYVMGGFGENTIKKSSWKLSNQGTWQQLPDLIEPVYGAVCEMHNGIIYLMGDARCRNFVQGYDVKSNSWSMKKKMPLECNRSTAAGVEHTGKLTLFTSSQMMLYDDVTDTWDTIQYTPYTSSAIHVMKHRGQLRGIHFHGNEMMQYLPNNNTWKKLGVKVPQLCDINMLFSMKICV